MASFRSLLPSVFLTSLLQDLESGRLAPAKLSADIARRFGHTCDGRFR